MKSDRSINSPTRKERISLWIMICLGLIYMFLFIKTLINTREVEFPPLFWMLIFVLTFYCIQIIHEWIHYLFITVPETPQASKVYTVDIFTTFCAGEPYEMIVETLHAIKNITYPHNTYLCDEADDPFLKNLCQELNIHHITRTNKINAKAGNINNALKHSSGELCVVLDPDHVPSPSFLDPIVSHFDNPDIGFVQIVQAYKNYAGGLIAKGAAQQTFQFYGPIMMTMNKYGTVLAIGANCTFRRAALESIGGHAAGLAEDMHTAMQLHAKGWKSVYVPSVLARGLVPDTLSAYYSQQLKWSRGVFELLVTSYPKLFRKFTWQQKLHYALIPMHYFSGVIFLINFLIPVISLIFNISPINLNLVSFVVMGFPLALSVILIRHFVQSWVMEDDERGFHVVGGLLMIGTWWMFILGFVYTILRKKVPYIPTPKDGKEDNNWHLSIPNIIIILISIVAIYQGLSSDWNPYTLIMSCFAIMNCGILSFSILASRQMHFRRWKMRNSLVSIVFNPISFVKNKFWKARHKVYRSGKNVVLPLSIGIAIASFILTSNTTLIKPVAVIKSPNENILLSGIFAPPQNSGLSSAKFVREYQETAKGKFDIVSYYIAWGDQEQCFVPFDQLDSAYNNGSVPLITWEPWQTLFDSKYSGDEKEKKIFSRILAGEYDSYLERFSDQIKSLNKPVYIRFAHETDNPFYPWSATGNNTPTEFKDAWRYVHTYFQQKGANNVIWVWNPWKPDAIKAYFPGKDYVDWIGVTNLNYGKKGESKMWYSMEQLYEPFRKNAVFRSGIPVMLAEMGSLSSEGLQQEWFKQAFSSIKAKFPEIKAFVLFNSEWDNNIVDSSSAVYDWRIGNIAALSPLREHKEKRRLDIESTDMVFNSSKVVRPKVKKIGVKQGIKGVNYNRGRNWLTDYRGFKKSELIDDLTEMKRIGINSVRWYGPGVYDQNFLSEARKQQLDIHYTFWISSPADPLDDKRQFDKLSEVILDRVRDLKGNNKIVAWSLGNPVLQILGEKYFKPQIFYHQNAYLGWLRQLVIDIKKADPSRPITIDVAADRDLIVITDMISAVIPEIDSYGIVVNGKSSFNLIKQLKVNYFFSKVDVKDYLRIFSENKNAFITNWQDEEKKNFISFDGLKDVW